MSIFRSRVFRAAVPFCGAAPLLFLSAPLAAQTADEELREVIVTGHSIETSLPLELSRFGVQVDFITDEQVNNNGFVDLANSVEMLIPSVYVAPQAGAFSYVNIALQGSRTADVLWTVDGVRINNRLYNTTSPADTMPASMIERVEVLKAGEGLLYGTQAVAGVINTVTRGFSDTLDGSVSLGGDTNSGLHADGYVRGAIGGNKLVFWASKDESDGYSVYDQYTPGSTTRDRHYDVSNFGGKYGYSFSEDLHVSVTGIHTDAALDYPNLGNTDVNKRAEDIVSARLDYAPTEGTQFFIKGYFHDWDTDYYPVDDPDDSAFWGFKDIGATAAVRLQPGGAVTYDLGYDFQKYSGRDEYLLIAEQSEQVNAFYGQVRTTDDFSKKLRLSAGVRYNDTGGSSATVWNVSGIYNFTDNLFIQGLVGTSFRLPDAYELYAIDPFDTHGNPNLKPEESRNLNLSIGGNLTVGERALNWSVSGWYRQVENLIDADDTSPPPGFDSVFINFDDEVEQQGFELLLRAPLTPALVLDTSYTYSDESLQGGGGQIANRPRNSAKLGLSYGPSAGRFGADVALKYVGEMYANAGSFGRQEYGDFVVVNLGAHAFLDNAHHHRIGARVENLFDEDYATRVRNSGTAFVYRNLGTPITGYLNYTVTF